MHHWRSCPRPTPATPQSVRGTRIEQDELLGGFRSARRRDEAGLRAPLTVVREKRFSSGRCRVGGAASGAPRGRRQRAGAIRPRTDPPGLLLLAPLSTGSLLCWRCRILEGRAPAPRRRFARTSGPAWMKPRSSRATAASTAGSSSTAKMAGGRWGRQGDAGLGLRQRAVAKRRARPASRRTRSGSAALRPIRRHRSRRRARSRRCRW